MTAATILLFLLVSFAVYMFIPNSKQLGFLGEYLQSMVLTGAFLSIIYLVKIIILL